jgi:hypothetical protein
MATMAKSMPLSAAAMNSTVAKFNVSMTNANKLATQHNTHTARNITQLGAIGAATSLIKNSWTSIGGSVNHVYKNIGKITSKLLHWGTITAAFTGLIGGGTLFGIDKLAQRISAQRKSALGLGISFGQQASANLNFNRLINPGSLLENSATAKYDYTSDAYVGMVNAGVSPSRIASKDAGTLSIDVLKNIYGIFSKMDKGLWGSYSKATKIDQIIPLNDIVAIMNAEPDERKRMIDDAIKDNETLNLTKEAQRKWQDFTTALGRASKTIETELMEKLKGIEPGLEHLTEVITGNIVSLLESKVFGEWITGLSDGIESFSKKINDEEINKFFNWIASAAESVWGFAQSILNPDMSFNGKDQVSSQNIEDRRGNDTSMGPWHYEGSSLHSENAERGHDLRVIKDYNSGIIPRMIPSMRYDLPQEIINQHSNARGIKSRKRIHTETMLGWKESERNAAFVKMPTITIDSPTGNWPSISNAMFPYSIKS